MAKIAALLTCHNRCQKTLACLEALFQCKLPDKCSLEVYVVDDGSHDGTGDALRQRFPAIHLIEGDGSLYWNGGMRIAFAAAVVQGYDYYLWLNDDTTLYKNTLVRLLKTERDVLQEKGVTSIIVGATQVNLNGVPTYGGLNRASCWKPLKLYLVPVSDVPQPCDTMNGNCVLIPGEIAHRVGNLEKAFVHSMGDVDYGFRARKKGHPIYVMPEYAGICRRNSLDNTHLDRRLSRLARLRKITSTKELPLKSWFVLTSQHGGVLWPVYWVWPYLKVLIGINR
jgi:GT2 family glycosyltransferase